MKSFILLCSFLIINSFSGISQTSIPGVSRSCVASNIGQQQLECDKFSFEANASSSFDAIILGYYWTFGDGSTSTLENPIHTYSSNGSYIVTLTTVGININSGNCCSSQTSLTVNVSCSVTIDDCGVITNFLELNPNCSPNVFYRVLDSQIQLNPGWSITAYDWNHVAINNGTVVNSGGNPSNVNLSDNFNDGGWNSTLTITAVNSNGQICTFSKTKMNLSGGSDGSPGCSGNGGGIGIGKSLNPVIYPNPTSDELKIDFSNNRDLQVDNVKFVIRDLQAVQKLSGEISNGNLTKTINVSSLKKGIYFLDLIIDNKRLEAINKIVIE